LARHRPQTLIRVHGAAVADHADDFAVRAGYRCTHRDRPAEADRAAHVVEPVVGRRTGAWGKNPPAGGDGFVDHDRTLGHRGAERLAEAFERELAGRSLGTARLRNTRWPLLQRAQLG